MHPVDPPRYHKGGLGVLHCRTRLRVGQWEPASDSVAGSARQLPRCSTAWLQLQAFVEQLAKLLNVRLRQVGHNHESLGVQLSRTDKIEIRANRRPLAGDLPRACPVSVCAILLDTGHPLLVAGLVV